MDPTTAALIFTITAWLLSFIVGLIILYWIIRGAITGALRSHYYWVRKNEL